MTHDRYGLCGCGCGERTAIATYTCRRDGYIKGQPKRFIRHHWRVHPDNNPGYRKENHGYVTPCWTWQGFLDKGYGKLYRPQLRREGKTPTVAAHRWYYEQRHGPVDPGLHLDHLCRNRACVNPEHLEPVTCAENLHRGAQTRLRRDDVIYLRTHPLGNVDELAERFGVDRSSIYAARNGKTWKSLSSSFPPVREYRARRQ